MNSLFSQNYVNNLSKYSRHGSLHNHPDQLFEFHATSLQHEELCASRRSNTVHFQYSKFDFHPNFQRRKNIGRTESFPFPFLSQGNFGKIWKETFPRIFKSFPRFGKRFTKPFLLLLKPFLVDK